MQDSSSNLIIKTLPPSLERLPLFIVGDVHGCARELSEIIETAKKHVPKFQLLLVGDLFTKGPDPVGVYELIQEHKALCIKGNHDWALAASIIQMQKRGLHVLSPHTQQTLQLIRYHKRSISDLLSSLPHAYTTTITPQIHPSHWENSYSTIIVHAGIDPLKGLLATTERMLLTARYLRWDYKTGEKSAALIPSTHRHEVLGAHKTISLLVNHDTESKKFRWHEAYNGPELIIFGHDAKQGLFRKTLPSGRPICVGIDTGCTYGNNLTGYFPELDVAVQVRAHRRYFDVKRNLILIRSLQNRNTAV